MWTMKVFSTSLRKFADNNNTNYQVSHSCLRVQHCKFLKRASVELCQNDNFY